MNVKVLIDNIVRQTTVLIAQLATATGTRAPLAHIANEVFLNLVHELESHGVTRKVAADMFGMALRSYQQKVRRLEESETERDRSLWEAVFDFICDHGPVTRAQVSQQFARDDDRLLASVLHDQVESGLICVSGRGPSALYRLSSPDEVQQALEQDPTAVLEALVWIATYRYGPIDATELAERLGLAEDDVASALDGLAGDGRLDVTELDGVRRYRCLTCVLPVGSPIGWEAALFDHYTALVQAMAVKLEQGVTRTFPADVLGGSTYSFEVWSGHPFEERVLALLRDQRAAVSRLREEVERYNQAHGIPEDGYTEVVFYFGQSVRAREADGQAKEDD